MLGTYRYVLALLVAASHAGLYLGGAKLNPGVMAVACFYLVSGFVMTGQLRTRFEAPRRWGLFYRDRALRLLPHYFVVAGITLAWVLASGATTDFLRHVPTGTDIVRNALVVPLDFYMFNRSDEFTLIPPAWSLGAEIQFYVVVPLLLYFGFRGGFLFASLGVFACAAAGWINSDWYGYRLLPGVLFLFLLGSFTHDAIARSRESGRTRKWLAIVATVGAALGATALALTGKIALPYTREILLGLVAGTWCLALLAPCKRRAWDEALGNLSYGVFLNHFLVLWTVFHGKVEGAANIALYLLLSTALALLLYNVVERPMLALRRRKRGEVSTASSPAPS